ncbi:MAG: phosphate ABC transporter substrate-binding protein, partial [Candidatus Omnitrophica bacterium]|nr:phosphate ABC transporter substrate-binding protein [Candidatus Omnitrophota bacterium]
MRTGVKTVIGVLAGVLFALPALAEKNHVTVKGSTTVLPVAQATAEAY